MSNIIIRKAIEQDFNFIKKSMLLRLSNTNQYKMLTRDVFFSHFNNYVDDLLENETTLVAVNSEDDTQIFGFIIFGVVTIAEVNVIHFVYVKQPFRQLGICRRLVNESVEKYMSDVPKIITNHTPEGKQVIEKILESKVFYNPFLKRT